MNAWGSSLISALILGVAIVIAGLLVGGGYTAISVQAPKSTYAMVTNRLTGNSRICSPQVCRDLGELPVASNEEG